MRKTTLKSFASRWFPLFAVAGCLPLGMAHAQDADALPKLEMKVAFPNLAVKRPLWVEEAPDGSKHLFLVEQDGRVLILPAERDGKETKTFLDISNRKPYQQDEEGLLGFAFHPKFKENRKFYVFYTQQDPKRSVISEFQASAADPTKADLSSERVLLEIQKPYWNHNGGCLVFGPDGYLYISVGDGGAGRDPHNFGQSLNVLYAKILRIDVETKDGQRQYGIPKDNPFVGPSGAERRPEIWAYGLRNVWRMSFDRQTGALWASDVGQDKFEEVDVITKGGNYGWSVVEAFHPFKDIKAESALIDPVIEYGHSPALAQESKFPEHAPGQSITGGFVYRGKKMPSMNGVYIYADYMSGNVFGLRYENGKLGAHGLLVKGNPVRRIASFGQDLDGELYVLPFNGKIYELSELVK